MSSSSCNLRMSVKSRREFLQKSSFGFGALALEQLMSRSCLGKRQLRGSFESLGAEG